MSFRATRTVSLSVAVLLASTSIASAGFIWLSPDKPVTEAQTYSQQAEPALAADAQTQGRAWTVDPSVPVAGATPAAPATTDAAPAPAVTLTAAPPPAAPGTLGTLPVEPAPAQSTDAGTPAPVPAAVQSQPLEMTSAAPAPANTEVTLASTSSMPQASVAAAQSGATTAASMPNAEAMISSMPSMTAPASTPAATGDAVATQMLSPATAPIAAAQATSPTPAAAGIVSMVTGETVATAGAAAPSMNADKVVSGFGKHVPLVIAMRQILPEGYGFAHGDGVDLSTSVDWQGGKPWPQVLDDAIKPIGLSASISGDTVMLQKAVAAMAPELSPPAANSSPAPSDVLVPVAATSTAQLAPGQAILTNATVMQAPPSDN